MESIKVKKQKLVAIIRKNRDEHRAIFLQAQTNYREVAVSKLDEQLKAARDGAPFELRNLSMLVAPEDHTADYDRVIGMLDMSVDDIIEVSATEFSNYVQDIWSWSRNWATSNMRYSGAMDAAAMSKLNTLANG